MAWMENIVEIGFVFQNRGTKHFKTCSNYGPAPERDERTCWSCLCGVEHKKNRPIPNSNNKSKQQAMAPAKSCIGLCKWTCLHAFKVLEPLF
jgi:hypothetical protein